MITGFNPADMYGVDHISRVLQTFPGVFSGIGEFTIHKEFVSAKISGETASLANPALDRILDFAAEVGLVVLIHNDIDVPFATAGAQPVYLSQMKALLARHPNATIIWAHTGLGRVVHPVSASAGFHVALRAPSRDAVRRFYVAALEHGGRDGGPPGLVQRAVRVLEEPAGDAAVLEEVVAALLTRVAAPPPQLEQSRSKLFNRTIQGNLEDGQPHETLTLTANYSAGRVNVNLANRRSGPTAR
jgi:hypothetical protein